MANAALNTLRRHVSGAIERGEARPIVAIRPISDIVADGMAYDALGYPIMALWLACFVQAYEATHVDA